MPILVEPRNGQLVTVETSTGRIVDRIEVRDGIMYYVASDGEVLESKTIGIARRFSCTACGRRCEAANLTGYRPDCPKGYPAPRWKETK